jgi:hypothetical protein
MPDRKLTDYAKWLPEAIKVERTDNPLNVPYDVALEEAVQLAAFINKYWEKKGERPGLSRVKKRLPKSTADDLVSLVHGVQEAQTKLLLIVDPIVVDIGARAREVAGELEAALEFVLDDDVEEPADKQLAKIQQYHAEDGQRSTTLAQALRDFAALATTLRDRLVEADEEFDPKLIDEAKKLAKKLSEQPAQPAASTEAAAKALEIRNQMLHLLVARVGLVRRTAAYVFVKYPDIAKEAMSTYERRRRAANRRAKAAKDAEAAKAAEAKKAADEAKKTAEQAKKPAEEAKKPAEDKGGDAKG